MSTLDKWKNVTATLETGTAGKKVTAFCRDCGTGLPGGKGRSVRCLPCRSIRWDEKVREGRKRRHAKAKAAG